MEFDGATSECHVDGFVLGSQFPQLVAHVMETCGKDLTAHPFTCIDRGYRNPLKPERRIHIWSREYFSSGRKEEASVPPTRPSHLRFQGQLERGDLPSGVRQYVVSSVAGGDVREFATAMGLVEAQAMLIKGFRLAYDGGVELSVFRASSAESPGTRTTSHSSASHPTATITTTHPARTHMHPGVQPLGVGGGALPLPLPLPPHAVVAPLSVVQRSESQFHRAAHAPQTTTATSFSVAVEDVGASTGAGAGASAGAGAGAGGSDTRHWLVRVSTVTDKRAVAKVAPVVRDVATRLERTGVFHEVDRAALEAVSVVPSVMPQASTPFLKRKKLTLREAQDRMLKKTRTDMGMPM